MQNGSNLEAVLLDQMSTTALLLDTGVVNPVGVEENANSIYFIYKLNNEIKTVDLAASGTNAVKLNSWVITSNGGGSLTSEKYVKDSNGTLHFVYFDSKGQPSQYDMPDLMYYNTSDQIKDVLHFGFRENYGGSDYMNSYVHEVAPDIAIDNNDNVVIIYAYRDWSVFSSNQDHHYYLKLINPQTMNTIMDPRNKHQLW
jgi:hypothetical protein